MTVADPQVSQTCERQRIEGDTVARWTNLFVNSWENSHSSAAICDALQFLNKKAGEKGKKIGMLADSCLARACASAQRVLSLSCQDYLRSRHCETNSGPISDRRTRNLH